MRANLLAVLFVSSLACSSSTDETTAGGGGATSMGSSSGGSSSSGVGSPLVGFLTVQQAIAAGAPQHFNSALFLSAPLQPSDCTVQTIGPCSVSTCGTNSAATFPPQEDGGAVTFTSPANTSTLTWDGERYLAAQESGVFVEPGDTVQVSVEGSTTVPSFDASVDAPASVVIDSTALQPSISRSQAYTFSWTGTGDGELTFGLSTRRTVALEQAARVSFSCTVPITDGVLTVPLDVVTQLLPTGESNCPGTSCEETTAQVTLALGAATEVDISGSGVRLAVSAPPELSSLGSTPTDWTVIP